VDVRKAWQLQAPYYHLFQKNTIQGVPLLFSSIALLTNDSYTCSIYRVEGTGELITVSSCHKQTNIKVKMSVFTGSCTELECVTGGEEPDYECPLLKQPNKLSEWNTLATAVTFPSVLGQNYYILVQQSSDKGGTVWLNFRAPKRPQNDNCVDAIGPVPRDMTTIAATSKDSTISTVPKICDGAKVPAFYPGTWFQLMGTGESVSIMSCGPTNFNGYAFSVYHGANCDSLQCVSGTYKINAESYGKCAFGGGQATGPMTKYTFDTIDRDRYYVYVYFAQTQSAKPTAPHRFFVDDGENGEASSSGAHAIQFDEIVYTRPVDTPFFDDKSDKKDGEDDSGASSVRFHRSGFSLFVLFASLIIHGHCNL